MISTDLPEIKELEALLGDEFPTLVLLDAASAIEKETFQSRDFIRAGYQTRPELYGLGDRFLYTITHADGKMTMVVAGKIATGRPTELGSAITECLDLRPGMTVIYQYDGLGTITETRLADRSSDIYQGQYGKPDAFLPVVKSALGRAVSPAKV